MALRWHSDPLEVAPMRLKDVDRKQIFINNLNHICEQIIHIEFIKDHNNDFRLAKSISF